MSDYEPTDWEYYYGQPDNWGGLQWSDVDEFMFRYLLIEEAQQMGNEGEVLARFGYSSLPEWTHVVCTFFRHHFGSGGQIPADDVMVDMYGNPQFQQASTNATMRMMQDKQEQAVAGDPGLTAPFEGVTIETWAQAAVGMVNAGNDANAIAQVLAKYQMDRAKYDRVAAEFQARMQRDMTGAIATIYGNAFTEAQSSTMPAAGADGGGGGGEPLPWEKYCEISGAMNAWAEQGGDVNGLLQSQFGIDTMQWANIGSYWSGKYMTDVALLEEFGTKSEEYKLKYSAADPDADLDVI